MKRVILLDGGVGQEVFRRANKPFGGYANAFRCVNALKFGGPVNELVAREDLDEKAFVKNTMHLIQSGARIVGGCCGVGPLYIKTLHDEMLKHGGLPVSMCQNP